MADMVAAEDRRQRPAAAASGRVRLEEAVAW